MDSHFTPPTSPDFSSENLSEDWKIFKQELKIYLTATEKLGKSDEVKTSILLQCLGKEGRKIYRNFNFQTEEDSLTYSTVLEKFEEFCNPRKNVTLSRFQFLTARQEEAESFDGFVTKIKTLSQDCELGELCDSLVRDVIIIGTNDIRLQEKLLAESDLTLERAIKAGRTTELTRQRLGVLQREIKSVNFTKKSPSNKKNMEQLRQRRPGRSGTLNSSDNTKTNDKIQNCRFCSFSHYRGNCPAYGQTCNKCKKRNHFASRCPANRSVHKVDYEDSDLSSTDDYTSKFVVDCISKSSTTNKKEINNYKINATSEDWNVNLEVNGTDIEFKIDSGSQVNILPTKDYQRLLKRPNLKSTGITLSAYNNTSIPVQGKCIAKVTKNNLKHHVMFIVADIDASPILGLETCTKLNLIKKICQINTSKLDFLSKFKDCFGELGKLPGTHHITMDPKIKPVINPPRNIPFALKKKLKEELKRMTELGVITPVTEPTEWVSSLVVVEKPNGSLRVCLDPRNLNKAIKREHYRLPTASDIIHEMAGAKFFTKLDASNAFWQIEVDEESSKLLTFNSPCGRFKFTRLPYGIHSASEICHAKIASIIEQIEGCRNSQDDIIIWADTPEVLQNRTIEVLLAIRRSGMKLNQSKCQFNINKLIFLGHKISSQGVEPDEKKCKAIIDMPDPTTKTELQRFLGMINYLGKFIPNLSNETAPLRLLLEKDNMWSFDKPQKEAVQRLKNLVTQSPILKYFDPVLPIRVSSDASTLGLGAMLEQKHNDNWAPVAFASRSLTPAERNYCPLELEMLSIVFACEHFHEFLYGQRFLVNNDHKPLKTIVTKPIAKAPPRIQRFLMRLQKYDFEIAYTQGKLMHVADTLSRAALTNNTPEISDKEINFFVHSIMSSIPISDKRQQQLTTETANDETLQKLKQQIMIGWPQHRHNLHPCLHPYFNYRSDLTCHKGLVMKGQQIVIPLNMRVEMRRILHQAHLGIEKTKSNARQALFWPNMNKEIEDMVRNCDLCQRHNNRQSPEPQIPHDIPDQPWHKVGTDLFKLQGKDYLIVVDYYSKFFEIALLADTTAPTVIRRTKNIFAKHGIPKLIISDNGPQFKSREYKKFATEWDFSHVTSSPEYPQSNGLVERTIQTVKKTLHKCFQNRDDPYLALLTLRTTPGKNNSPSPAAKLMNRQLRTLLPIMRKNNADHYRPTLTDEQAAQQRDRGQRELTPLKIGDQVRVHDGKTWSRLGMVTERCSQPRSYLVLMENGRTIRRNRRHLLQVPCSKMPASQPYPDTIFSTPRQVLRPNSELRPVISESGIRTRSGRLIRQPRWMQDYAN